MEIYTESNVPTKEFCFIYFTGMHMEHLFCVTFVMFQILAVLPHGFNFLTFLQLLITILCIQVYLEVPIGEKLAQAVHSKVDSFPVQ